MGEKIQENIKLLYALKNERTKILLHGTDVLVMWQNNSKPHFAIFYRLE